MIISADVARELTRLQRNIEAACIEIPAATRDLRIESAALRRTATLPRTAQTFSANRSNGR